MMPLWNIIGVLKSGLFPASPCYSVVDKITYFTIYIIAGFLGLTAVYPHSFPVTCVLPASLTSDQLQWAESFCATHSSRLFPFLVTPSSARFTNNLSVIFNEVNLRNMTPLSYYEGLPWIFACVLVFVLIVFRAWYSMLNMNAPIRRLLEELKESSKDISNDIDAVQPAAQLFIFWLESSICRVCGFKLVFIYVIFKLLIVAFFSAFFVFLQHFLGMEDMFWAVSVFSDSWLGTKSISDRFKPDIFCKIHQLIAVDAKLASPLISCNFPLLAVYKYACLFAWIWAIFIACLNSVHCLTFILLAVYGKWRAVCSYCWNGRQAPSKEFVRQMEAFAKAITPDGVFIIELMETTFDQIAAKVFCLNIWENFFHEPSADVQISEIECEDEV